MARRGKILAFIGVEYSLTAVCTLPLFLKDLDLSMGYISRLMAQAGAAVEVPVVTLPQAIGAGLLARLGRDQGKAAQ